MTEADPIPPPSERDIEFTKDALKRIALDPMAAGWGSFARVLHAVESRVAELEAELATARATNGDAEDAMRDLAFTLSAGGYNSPTFDVEVFHKKIKDGIDMLTKPLENRVNELVASRDTLVARLKEVVAHTSPSPTVP